MWTIRITGGDTKTPEYLAMNPLGKVPLLLLPILLLFLLLILLLILHLARCQ